MRILDEKITNLKLNTENEVIVALFPCENSVLVVFKNKDLDAHGAIYVDEEGRLPGEAEPIIIYKPLILGV